jgi:glycosyltransferase involved in cell wall biosynthesis
MKHRKPIDGDRDGLLMNTAIGSDEGQISFFKGVTIGIPVFNEEKLIRRAAESVVSQCERLIIADNASSDGTQQVCLDLAREFPNIEYIRHAQNRGALENWHFLLAKAETPYLMVLGSHDFVAPNFIRILKQLLDSDSNAVLAAAALHFQQHMLEENNVIKDSVFSSWTNGALENVVQRVRSAVFDDVNLSWAMYGLYRAEVYKKCFTRDLPIVGGDNVFLCKVSTVGKMLISNETAYYAQSRGRDTGHDYVMRITANSKMSTSYEKIKSQRRIQIYHILNSVEQPKSFLKGALLRYMFMSRHGTFKIEKFDLMFFLLVIPSKIASEIRRAVRMKRIKRNILNSGQRSS